MVIIIIADLNVWSTWSPSIKWCHSSISNAHQELSNSQVSGNITHQSPQSFYLSGYQRSLFLQLLRNRLVATARKSIKKNASLGQLYNNMQEAYHHMQTPLVYQQPQVRTLYFFFFFPIIEQGVITKSSFFLLIGFKRTKRINNPSNYIHRKPQRSS